VHTGAHDAVSPEVSALAVVSAFGNPGESVMEGVDDPHAATKMATSVSRGRSEGRKTGLLLGVDEEVPDGIHQVDAVHEIAEVIQPVGWNYD
jgi:hypothetical protein